MPNHLVSTLALSTVLLAGGTAMAQAVVGQPAPAFSATDATGKTVALADLKGKFVVLEWMSPDCPFVQKHYGSGNMQATQKAATAKGAVWLAVHTGSAGSATPATLQGWMKSQSAAQTALLMDGDARVARAYGARTTPHMYVIDTQGKLVYAGAIDSKPTANPADVKTATNYVAQALGETMAGKAVSQATTQAYGCSVKYPNAG